ncbi:hypothetical protein HK102_000201 [Quaeritorhiza haematococci]|nr:hypothetical protein HK102_000201 [Quaeritorhiza haematococci]
MSSSLSSVSRAPLQTAPPKVPPELWVQFTDNITAVSTEKCSNLLSFINAIKRNDNEFSQLALPKLPITLHPNQNEDPLRPLRRPLSDLPDLEENDEDHPLIIKIAKSAALHTTE